MACLGSARWKGSFAQGTFIDCIAAHDRAPGLRKGPIVNRAIDPEIIANRSEGIDQEGRLWKYRSAIPTRFGVPLWQRSWNCAAVFPESAFLVNPFRSIRDDFWVDGAVNDWAFAKSGCTIVTSNAINKSSLRITTFPLVPA